MAETLETLIVKLLADDSDLEKQLKDIVANAKTYGTQASAAFNNAANLSFGGSNAAATSQSNTFKQAADAADSFRTKLRNLDADVRRGAVSANVGAKAFDALTKEMVQQRRELPDVSKGYERLSVQISRSASSADRLRGRVNGLSFANQIRSANGFASSMRVLQGEIALFVSALGIKRLVRGLNDASESYYSAVIAQRLYDRELQKSGTSFEAGQRAVNALAAELRTTDDVIQNGAVQLLRYGATIEQAEVLMRSGAASGLAFGRTVSQGIEAIAQAIVGEQSQILNRIGIAGNLSTAYAAYAKDLGVTTEQLTQQQKVQAALNMILRETASEIEALPVLFDGLAGAKNRFSVASTLASRAVGQEFEPALTALYNAGADVLILFTDNLVPVLAEKFNPLIEQGTTNLSNFITRLTDSSEAGIELRAQMAATSTVLITFGEGFLIAGTYAFGFVTDVLGGFAGIGAAIGTVSAQFENFIGGLSQGGLAISQLLSPNLQTRSLGIASLAGLKEQGVFNTSAFNFDDIINSAAQAQEAYRKSAQGAYDTAAASIERLTNLGPNVEAFFDAMAMGDSEGVKNSLSQLTDINSVVEDMDGSTTNTTKKVRTFNDALADYRQGLSEINLTYDVTNDRQAALEEQLRLTEGTFKELVSLALSDGVLSDAERSTIQLFATDLGVLEQALKNVLTAKENLDRNFQIQINKNRTAQNAIGDDTTPSQTRVTPEEVSAYIQAAQDRNLKRIVDSLEARDLEFAEYLRDTFDLGIAGKAPESTKLDLLEDLDLAALQAAEYIRDSLGLGIVGEGFTSLPYVKPQDPFSRQDYQTALGDGTIPSSSISAREIESIIFFLQRRAVEGVDAAFAEYQRDIIGIGLYGKQFKPTDSYKARPMVELLDDADLAIAEYQRDILNLGLEGKPFEATALSLVDSLDALDLQLAEYIRDSLGLGVTGGSFAGTSVSGFTPSNAPSLDFIFGRGTPTQTINFAPPELEELNNAIVIIDALTSSLQRLGGTNSNLANFANGVTEVTNVVTNLATSIASGDVFAIIASSMEAASFLLSEIIDVYRNRVNEAVKEIAGSFDLLSEATIAALSKTKIETDFFLFIPYNVEVLDEKASELGFSIANNVANGIAQGLADADFNFAEFFDNLIFKLKAEAIVNLEATQAFILEYTKLIQDVLAGRATQADLDAFEIAFSDYLKGERDKLGLPPSKPPPPDDPDITTNPLQFGSSPSAISFAVNSDFLEGSRNMNTAALLLIDVFGGAGVPSMNVTTTGPDYAAFNTTQKELNATYNKVINMYNRVLDEGFKFDFGSGTTQTVSSITARKR